MIWPFRRKPKTTRTPRAIPVTLRARFDAAETTAENARHWAMADSLSADAAASPDVRRKLRERARYEVANNSYARGIVLTLANDCIGTGPRLQLAGSDSRRNNRIEAGFADWAAEIELAGKLRAMRMAKASDGEAFAVLTANPMLASPIKLDLQLIEADRVAAPTMTFLTQDNDIDGIRLDPWGNPHTYTVLRHHSGDIGAAVWIPGQEADTIDADSMVHWFRADRPGQHRGVPELLPALPLFAQLRRYTLAVLAAAETAADFAAVLFTDSPANGEAQALEPMDVVELEKRMATVLPDGWRLGQIEAQQPTTSYAEFKREILNEIARCLNIPFNIAAGNSAGYNYASGRLDHQTYYRAIRIEQAHLGQIVLDRILKAWMWEAALTGTLPISRQMLSTTGHQWFFDGSEHVDPLKEAGAQARRLRSNTTTLANEYARQGKDWEAELHQRAREMRLMQKLGLSTEATTPGSAPATTPAKDSLTDATDPARIAA